MMGILFDRRGYSARTVIDDFFQIIGGALEVALKVVDQVAEGPPVDAGDGRILWHELRQIR